MNRPIGNNILLMEPDEMVRSSMRLFLQNMGYEVDTAATAKKAKDLLALGPYAVVICARYMPDTDGLQFISNLHRVYPQMLIVLEADFGSNIQFLQAAKVAGVNEFIEKPFSAENITAMMNRLPLKIAEATEH